MYLNERGRIEGLAYFGRQVVLAAESDDAVRSLAQRAPAGLLERMIVGPRKIVETYWKLVRATHLAPRLIRRSQPVMAVSRARLRGSGSGVAIRHARDEDWQIVAEQSAAMILQELEYDARLLSPEFDAGVRAAIARGLWWVAQTPGELCFFCNEGPRSADTLQLQGIWTPPALRRKGFASAALYGICEILLRGVPSVSLYVNDFNTAAIALYERLGFERAGEFSTILF